jgi:hypothetical protein
MKGMTYNQAAQELDAVRNELAGGANKAELIKRVDAVGAWLALQKWAKQGALLLREAHVLRLKLG